MRRVLRFDGDGARVDGRRVRERSFTAVSSLPLSAVCLVGNGMREAVGVKLAAHAEVRILEPLLPSAAAMQLVLADALTFTVDGAAGELWLILRRSSVQRLLAAAFGERYVAERATFSPIEQRTLHRIVAEVAAVCAPLCGPVRGITATSDVARIAGCASYFEMVFTAPLDVVVGIALACDPPEPLGPRIAADAVDAMPLNLRVTAGTINLTLARLAALEIGDLLPMSKEEDAHLIAGDTIIARGTCGVSRGHAAFLVGIPGESSTA